LLISPKHLRLVSQPIAIALFATEELEKQGRKIVNLFI